MRRRTSGTLHDLWDYCMSQHDSYWWLGMTQHDSAWVIQSGDRSRPGPALDPGSGRGWTACSRLPRTILDSIYEIGNSHQCLDYLLLHHMTIMWPCWSRDRVWGCNPSEHILSDPKRVLCVCDLCSTCSDLIGTNLGGEGHAVVWQVRFLSVFLYILLY